MKANSKKATKIMMLPLILIFSALCGEAFTMIFFSIFEHFAKNKESITFDIVNILGAALSVAVFILVFYYSWKGIKTMVDQW